MFSNVLTQIGVPICENLFLYKGKNKKKLLVWQINFVVKKDIKELQIFYIKS